MYAIIATGGKQYRVSQGDFVFIEKLDVEVNSDVSFDALLIGDENATKIGTPTVKGAKVTGKVVAQGKGEKVVIFKYKSKKNYRRKAGHRQLYTKVEITGITA